MASICGAIIARDEASTVERCLRSLAWADSLLVVVDDRTTDCTAQIARACGAAVMARTFVNYAAQRNAALEAAGGDWVLFVDADEVVPPELAREVREAVENGPEGVTGYWIPRDNILFGRVVRYAGWSPDFQLRLLRRGRARYRADRTVHELVEMDGQAAYLRARLTHYNYATLRQFLSKQRTYAAMEAADMFRRRVQPKPHSYLLQPWRQFWRRYVTLAGYRGGPLGLLLSVLLAYYEFRTYLDLRSLVRSGGAPSSARPVDGC